MALRVLSETEFREPRQQAALIIRQELERRGLLAIETKVDPKHGQAVVYSLSERTKTAKERGKT